MVCVGGNRNRSDQINPKVQCSNLPRTTSSSLEHLSTKRDTRPNLIIMTGLRLEKLDYNWGTILVAESKWDSQTLSPRPPLYANDDNTARSKTTDASTMIICPKWIILISTVAIQMALHRCCVFLCLSLYTESEKNNKWLLDVLHQSRGKCTMLTSHPWEPTPCCKTGQSESHQINQIHF